MTEHRQRAERYLANALLTRDEPPALGELRKSTAADVAQRCGPTLTLRLAALVNLATTREGDDADDERQQRAREVVAERFGTTP